MKSAGMKRRTVVRGLLGAAATGALPRWALPLRAHAQAQETSSVLMVFLSGGYNALFSNADAFLNQYFGVTDTNIESVAPGVALDKATFGTMPLFAKSHLANIGVRHGISSHSTARNADVHMGHASAPLLLANALGGSASVKAAIAGGERLEGNHLPEGGVTLQRVTDMQITLNAFGIGQPDPKVLDRAVGANILESVEKMSRSRFEMNPTSLVSLHEALPTAAGTLRAVVPPFDFAELSTAYGLNASTRVSTQNSKFAAAEMLMRTGTNFVGIVDGGWDSHGDTTGDSVRTQMATQIMPGLNKFLERMVDPAGSGAAGRNVVVMIMGDFARSLPGSDHAPLLAATVIGKYVSAGASGKVQVANKKISLPEGTPSVDGLWSYVASVAKVSSTPFGANPHGALVRTAG